MCTLKPYFPATKPTLSKTKGKLSYSTNLRSIFPFRSRGKTRWSFQSLVGVKLLPRSVEKTSKESEKNYSSFSLRRCKIFHSLHSLNFHGWWLYQRSSHLPTKSVVWKRVEFSSFSSSIKKDGKMLPQEKPQGLLWCWYGVEKWKEALSRDTDLHLL